MFPIISLIVKIFGGFLKLNVTTAYQQKRLFQLKRLLYDAIIQSTAINNNLVVVITLRWFNRIYRLISHFLTNSSYIEGTFQLCQIKVTSLKNTVIHYHVPHTVRLNICFISGRLDDFRCYLHDVFYLGFR